MTYLIQTTILYLSDRFLIKFKMNIFNKDKNLMKDHIIITVELNGVRNSFTITPSYKLIRPSEAMRKDYLNSNNK